MKKLMITAFSTTLLTLKPVHAEEYNHFPSLNAPDTKVALCNLAKFNEKLLAITNKSTLTSEDMVKVHELTYTLENAVIRLKRDLETIAFDLEKVHKASERLDQKVVKDSGEKYLKASGLLVKPEVCT